MNINIPIQEFNERNSLSNLIFNYLIKSQSEFYGKKINELSKNYVKRIIQNYGIIVTSSGLASLVKVSSFKINDGDKIEIPNSHITFLCVKNLLYDDVEQLQENKLIQENESLSSNEVNIEVPDEGNEIDEIIYKILIDNLGTTNLSDITADKNKFVFALIVKTMEDYSFELIKTTKFSFALTDFIKSKISNTNIPKELDIQKNQLNFSGQLVDLLIQGKADKVTKLQLINDDLVNGYYNNTLFKYLQEYKKLITTDTFQYLVGPLLNNNISSLVAIENLLRIVNNTNKCESVEDKFRHYDINKPVFISYFEILRTCDEYNLRFYKGVVEYLFNQLKIGCNTSIEKDAHLKIEPTKRKYNFTNPDRLQQDIFLIISNEGEGLAKNIILSSDSINFEFSNVNIGILMPSEKREINISSLINFHKDFKPELSIILQWDELSGKQNYSKCILEFQVQKVEVPWDELKRKNPYSNSIIDDESKLYGRDEILDELKLNVLSDNIESFKLWGQKRVGKSSIVKTLKSILDSNEKIIVIYRSLGGLINTNPINTLNTLGESLCSEIYEEIDRKVREPSIRERLRGIQVPEFNGSLFPLEKYIKQLKRIDNTLKFIFILDEFDRINEEFFLPGNLGETLSLSIGKGLNEHKYIGFILVGSENMHLLDRQGINYNSYQEREVDTFKKESEYKSFVQIVKGPVTPYLNYSDEAVEKIFYYSNGNPYFANLICATIFKNIYKLKDTEIDSLFVEEAISTIITSSQKSHFEHYWGDGITEESNIKKERKADIRRRILVSFSMCSNTIEKRFPNKTEISKSFKRPLESEYIIEKYEVENTIAEFINRKIFVENELAHIRILPPLFENWLCDTGKTLMIEGISDLEALQREIDLEKELALKSDELNRLSENLHFKERKIDIETFNLFFRQFGGASEQRRVFKLFDSIFYISKYELLEFFRKESRNIFSKSEIHLKEHARTIFREGVELYTFSKYYDENVPVVDSFKLVNHIRKQKNLKSIKVDSQAWKKSGANEIIIIEPIIENFSKIREELFILLTDEVKKSAISIRIIAFVITTKAKADLITATSSFLNFKLVVFKEVEETIIKPFIQGTNIFENGDESNQAYYEVRKHFPNISKDVLLILFEDFCPSKSCPILWYQSHQFKPLFHNAFGTLEELNTIENDEESRRTRIYHANRELSQAMNNHIIKQIKLKANKAGKEDWFNVEFIPKNVLKSISEKWIEEGTVNPRESYFDFSDYKKIIEYNKELISIYNLPGEGMSWCDKLNVLRRDPAHPEKPAPTEKETEYFEKIKNQILQRL